MKPVKRDFFRKNYIFWTFILFLVLLQVFGCAYGKIRHSPIEVGKINEFINQHYGNFEIAYSGERDKLGAIRFDLKDDDILLTGKGWQPIEGKDQLDEMLDIMIAKYRYWEGIFRGPYLYLILDKNNNTIGYFYSPLDRTVVRPDGGNYRLDPITELDIREELRVPSIKGAGG